jgi:hypothetical protein
VPGTARLLTFAFRALILLLIVSILWVGVAGRYNEALVYLARPLLPAEVSIDALGTHLRIEEPGLAAPVSLDGFTLHYGLILMVVLVLAAVGISIASRVGWLLAMVAGAFALHILGVALMARGVVWAAGSASPEASGRLVFSLFAVAWGLLPAIAGGLWCYLYWMPRVSCTLENANQ